MTKLLAMPGEGERLDRFELVAEIASGGMATVYLARLVGAGGFKRFVAIKRLHPHLASEPEFIEMFLDEARLAARLHHPNVVPILEIGEHNGQYYLVMEYIEGDTAGRLVARAASVQQRLPPAIVARIMLDSLTGLHAAHELRGDDGTLIELVHRDVSPQNILVGVDGVARITDFGVARATARLTSTRAGQVKGKLAYLSPEQVRGVPIDRRADIFAAGIVMWELMTSERLFKGAADADTLFRIVAAEVPTMRTFQPSIHPAVEAVCLRALAREPQDRFQTAQDFAEALENASRHVGALANIRETASYVNELIGYDISQQREIVRAWLARSESRSGVAGTAAAPRPPSPQAPGESSSSRERVQPPRQPQMSVPTSKEFSPQELTSLADDDEDLATRVDQPLDEQEAFQPAPPAYPPQRVYVPQPSQPVYHQQPAYQPQPAPMQPLLNQTMAMQQQPAPPPQQWAPSPTQISPLEAPQGYAQQPPPQQVPFGMQQTAPAFAPPAAPAPPAVEPEGGRKLPTWTLAVPAALIAIALLVLAVRFVRTSAVDPGTQPAPPATSAAPPVAASTTPATTTQPSAVPSAVVAPPPVPVDSSPPLPSATAAPQPTAVAAPPPTSKPTVTRPVTVPTPKPTVKKPAVDNSDFGGRK